MVMQRRDVLGLVVALAVTAAGSSGCGRPGGQPSPHGAPAHGAPGGAGAPGAIRGFTAARAALERASEASFLSAVSAERVSAFHRTLTAEPHRATSPRNTALAAWIAEQWRAQGWDHVAVRTYEAYFTAPERVALEMVAPVRYQAGLREDVYAVDPQTADPRVPGAFNAYSASGEVTAEVVYAHGGNPDDYQVLRDHGISVTGKLVLVRYAAPYSFRGYKVMVAEREGAAGILIYSDPAEDGVARGPTFPDGPWGPDSHIQRGMASYGWLVPGDVTTPGSPAVAGARRIPPEQAKTLPHILALAISARDARPLLENMTGEVAPDAWKGGLPITYRLTGGVTAHLEVRMSTGLRTYSDVEARIDGSAHPDQWVVLGNHRDAWVYGGADPGSGTASLLELSRGLGGLANQGWRPARTIVVCSWDGEEEGLVGSTEWTEQYADSLATNLVAYLNVDTSIFGVLSLLTGKPDPNLEILAVPSLAPMIVEASHDVPAPNGPTLYDAWHRTRALELANPADLTDAMLVVTAVDASSDQASFLLHLGRPVIELTYAGQYGVYHSMYDDRYYMEHFGDPGFAYSANIAQLWGVLAMRLASADVVPFDLVPYADTIKEAISGLAALPAAGARLELGPLCARVEELRAAAVDLGVGVARLLAAPPATAAADELGRALMRFEHNWLSPVGLPDRPWSKHLIYGTRPTFHTVMLPGLTEAIERGDWTAAQRQLAELEAAVARNVALLQAASARIARSD